MTDYDYQVIDKEGKITSYVWCHNTRRMVIKRTMSETAVIYTNGSQECERMASLLRSLGGEFLEYKLGVHFTQRGFESEFGKDAEYPQINLGYKHIGSMKETLNHLKDMGLFT